MSTGDLARLLRRLCQADVQIRAVGDNLHYDAPAALEPELWEALREAKTPLLRWLSDGDGTVVRRGLPCYSQQEVWARSHQMPYPAVLGVTQRIVFQGAFQAETLRAAAQWLAVRHEPLRSRFRTAGDSSDPQPVIEVLDAVEVDWETVDLTDRPDDLDARCQQSVAVAFDLAVAPLWRMRVYRLAPEHHVLLWTIHHSICDGFSYTTLLDELLTGYQALRTGETPASETPAPTLIDFARQQRETLRGERFDALTQDWRTALAGASLRLDFPYDYPPPPSPRGRGNMREFRVDPETTRRLREVAKQLGSTLYLVALAAYALRLARFTGQDEVVLPISHANRATAGYEAVIGMIADKIPVRVCPQEADTFAALVTRLGHTVFSGLDRQAMPLSVLTGLLEPEQRPVPPYTHALFTLLEQRSCRQLPGLNITTGYDAPQGLARMEWYCFVTADDNGLHGRLEYPTDRFAPTTAEKYASDLVATLRRVAADPLTPISDI